jgi:hypothetical protein
VSESDTSMSEPYIMFSKEEYYGLMGSSFLMNITICNPTTRDINCTLLVTPLFEKLFQKQAICLEI